jgi:ADP-heptose:LPS heptosyltransferase
MLARNKQTINFLNLQQIDLKVWLREINLDIKNYDCGKHPSGHLIESLRHRIYALKDLQKNSKSLKQLAEIQKEIKIEIKRNDNMEAFLLSLAKKGD